MLYRTAIVTIATFFAFFFPETGFAQEAGDGLTLVGDTVTGTLANAREDEVATSVRLIVLLTTL